MAESTKRIITLALAAGALLLSGVQSRAQAYGFFTIAGVGCGSADGTNAAARFFYPRSGAVDGAGNLFVTDSGNHTIRRISTNGVVTTIAGLAGLAGSADGVGTNARFFNPSALALDSASNLYVVDSGNHTIRIVTPAGAVTTIAGKAGNYGTTDGTNAAVRFYQPMGIALDAATNIYVADTFNHTIRKLQYNHAISNWVSSTLAGQPGTNGSSDGTNAFFYCPLGLAVDGNTNIYVADADNSTIRVINPAGLTSTYAGLAGRRGTNDGTNSGARFELPTAIALAPNTNLYVVDGAGMTVRVIAPGGVTATVAGSPEMAGSVDGANGGALFNYPCGIAVDASGTNIYVADSGNNIIRKMSPQGQVVTFAGLAAGLYGSVDGTNTTARLMAPQAVAVDAALNVYVADTGNNTIRKITPAGVVTTLAGSPGVSGSSNGFGSLALFFRPTGIALDAATNIYVADNNNHTIRMVTPAGVVSTIAGIPGAPGYLDGAALLARFVNPTAVAVDAATNIYVADAGNSVIRKISPLGIVSTLAGMAGVVGALDSTSTNALFSMPQGIAVDGASNVYVADTANHTVRKISPTGVVTTLAGLAGSVGTSDGLTNSARFYFPAALVLDTSTNLYVADTYNWTIRKVTPSGVVTTVAGTAGSLGVADDTGPNAQFYYPNGIAVDSAGSLYVADAFNNSVREGIPILAPVLASQLLNQTDSGGSAVTFSINAQGAGTLSYQWQSNGVNIAGATNASLVIPGATPYAAASYDVIVSNSFGSATSQRAALTIVGPANDLFANPTVLTGTNFTVYGSNVGASVEPGEPKITGNVGGHSVWWTWTAPSDCTAELDTSGSSYDTVLGVYRGNTLSGLTLIAANDDYTNLTSRVVFGAKGGNTYRFDVDGYNGATGNIQLNLTTSAPVYPSITLQPQPQSDIPGASVAFSVGATGSAPINYQWRKNSGNISGATGSTLTINNLTTNSAATYTVVVSSELGTTNSVGVALTITNGAAFNTLAGSPAYGSADGIGSAARFHLPNDVASDAAGNIYVVDGANNTIRMVTPGGVVTTLAGLPGVAGFANGTGTNALFDAPAGIVVDAATNIYVSDSGNNLLRKIAPGGMVTTLAGVGGGGGYLDGPGSVAKFFGPSGLGLDAAGDIYVADAFNNLVRKITPAGVVSTVAGVPGVAGNDNGPATNATFYDPQGVDVDQFTNIYVADTGNSTIRLITPGGFVTNFAGTPSFIGSTDGPGSNALFNRPEGIGVDRLGDVYVADTGNNTLRFITPGGMVSTLAGLAGVPGSTDGTNSGARFSGLSGVDVDQFWNIYVPDDNNNTVRKITTNGVTRTIAGSAGSGTNDGLDPNARFNYPTGVAVDPAGNVYIADHINSTIREITISGSVVTIAGQANNPGYADGTNGGALFSSPSGLALDPLTNIYVADTGNNVIRKIAPGGVVTTYAGQPGGVGFSNGVGNNALFNSPLGVAVDSATNVLVADSGNSVIREISPAQVVATFAGVPGAIGLTDGSVSNALFGNPSGIAIDNQGNVYVSDTRFLTIRRISGGVVSTLAGSAGIQGQADGTGTAAKFGFPYGLATDGAGNLLVADLGNNTVRLITPQGMVMTEAGSAGSTGSSDGVGTGAQFFAPEFVAVDGAGHYFVTDGGNYTVRTTRPPPPMLVISYLRGYAVLSWPASDTGFFVQSTTSPQLYGGWTTLTNLPAVIGTNNIMSNYLGTSNYYFRLIR